MTRQHDSRVDIALKLEACASALDAVARRGLVRGSPEWRVLLLLRDLAPATQRDICRASGLSKTAVSRAARALEDARLAMRAPNNADGRSHKLVPTLWGEEFAEKLWQAMKRRTEALVRVLTLDERADLERILGCLEAAAGSARTSAARPAPSVPVSNLPVASPDAARPVRPAASGLGGPARAATSARKRGRRQVQKAPALPATFCSDAMVEALG